MQTINRQIASVAAKLTRQFFAANPNTEKTLSEVQKEMRRVAIEQIEADRVNAELDKIALGEASGDIQVADIEMAKQAFAEVKTISDFQQWSENFKTVTVLKNKSNGGIVESFKEIESKKPQNVGLLLRFKLSNGKLSDTAVPFISRFFEIVAK